MPPFSRGFRGRQVDLDPARVPPRQYVTRDFPVLSAGPTPRTPTGGRAWIAYEYGGEPLGDPWKEQRYWGD